MDKFTKKLVKGEIQLNEVAYPPAKVSVAKITHNGKPAIEITCVKPEVTIIIDSCNADPGHYTGIVKWLEGKNFWG